MNAVITGASKGIGFAIAKLFVQKGINICICSRDSITLNKAHQDFIELNSDVEVYSMSVDMSQKSEIKKFATLVNRVMPKLDILINNAGIYIPGQIHTEDETSLEKMLKVNLEGPYHLSRNLIPNFLKHQSGYIFNISSVAGITPYPNGGSYSISKYALTGFSKSLREELKDKGIKVITLYPGATWSDSWKSAVDTIPEDRLMQADDIAKIIYTQLLLSPSAVIEEIVIRPQLGDL